jgi:hypothetical protein
MSTPNIMATSETLNPNNTKKCFANLPKELRLEIWTHALPSPCEIEVFVWAEVLTSSPQHSLNLTFSFYTPQRAILTNHFTEHNRALALLRVNTESRDLYISKCPIVLPHISPHGKSGLGQLRMQREDILRIDNMCHLFGNHELFGNPEFSRTLREKFQLQDWWTQLQRISIELSGFERVRELAAVVESLRDLRVLELVKNDKTYWNETLGRWAVIPTGKFERSLDNSFVLIAGPKDKRMEIFIWDG